MTHYADTFAYKIIYIFTIDDAEHRGLLKIGETTLQSHLGPKQLPPNSEELNNAAKQRIDQFTKTALITYTLLHTELALKVARLDDGTKLTQPFSDSDVHAVLDRSGVYSRKFIETGRPSEWYKTDIQTAQNAITAVKENRSVLPAYQKVRSDARITLPSKVRITLRDEQKAAVDKTLTAFRTSNRMLWNCKMRFGKTIAAHELTRLGRFRKTLVVTHRPVVIDGWRKDHELIFASERDHSFVSKDASNDYDEFDPKVDSRNEQMLTAYENSNRSFTYFASMQDLRGSKRAGGPFNKNEAVFNIAWDLIIYDEAHEGTQTELGSNVRQLLEQPKAGHHPKVLELSGTPYNILESYEDTSNVFTWDYVMEQKRKQEFAREYPDAHNPYAELPAMKLYTFDLHEALEDTYAFETENTAFNFREFFRTWTGQPERDLVSLPENAEIGGFVHEKAVWAFLDLISSSDPESLYPFSKPAYTDMFRHTLWMVPGVREAQALTRMLRSHPTFSRYSIANVAGEGDEEQKYDDALQTVQANIKENGYTITISCGRLTTGVTVPEWSAVLMLSGSAVTSAASYMQTIFRVQSAGSVNGKQKQVAYVFDFAPDRALKVIADVHNVTSRHSKANDAESEVALGEFLNFFPVLSSSGTRMVEYDVPKFMRHIKKASVELAIKSGFEDDSIYDESTGIVMNEDDVDLFNKLRGIVNRQSKGKKVGTIKLADNGLTKEEYKRAERARTKPKLKRTPEEEELLNKQKQLKKEREKVLSLLRAISIRLPLLIYGARVDIDEGIPLHEFVDVVDDESWAEFMPLDVTKELFLKLLKYYDHDVVVGAGLRIRHLAKAADELPPSQRAIRITEILSLFRNPDKETVLTPWRVVNMHLSSVLGGYTFFKDPYLSDEILDKPTLINVPGVTETLFFKEDAKLLELNSKSGLYPLYLALSQYLARLPKPENEMLLDESRAIWHEVLKENVFILCKTKMAKSITIRTLAGYEPLTVNAIHLSKLTQRMENQARLANKISNPQTWAYGGSKMKFDAVVGNPPYQEAGRSGGSSDGAIYQYFAFQAEALEPNYISLLVPAKWFAGGRENELGEFRRHMLNNPKVRKLIFHESADEVFSTAEIKGGVCYYLVDRNYDGECEFVIRKDGTSSSVFRPLNDFDILIPDAILSDIIKKVGCQMDDDTKSVQTIVSGDTPFKLPTNVATNPHLDIEIKDSASTPFNTALYFMTNSQRRVGYIDGTIIEKNVGEISKPKVFMPTGYGAGEGFPHQILGQPEVAPSNSVCSQSYIFASFDSLTEAQNFVTYYKTKFFRALVSAAKVTQSAHSKVYRFVPLQEFTKPWTDEELYRKYNLSREEIDYIERRIKPMS